jgi:dethiobiotin synthetase
MTAAEQLGRPIDWPLIVGAYGKVVEKHDLVFVEGIGGVMVPFSENDFVLDLMVDLALPVLVVARASLGTINQSLLTVKACQSKGLSVCGILLSESGESGLDESRKTNCQDVARLSGIDEVAVINYCKSSCVKGLALGSELLAQLTQIQWIKELIHV